MKTDFYSPKLSKEQVSYTFIRIIGYIKSIIIFMKQTHVSLKIQQAEPETSCTALICVYLSAKMIQNKKGCSKTTVKSAYKEPAYKKVQVQMN